MAEVARASRKKSFQQIGPADQLAGQQLHRRLALQVAVLGQVDLAHGARPELLENLVAADGLTDHGAILARLAKTESVLDRAQLDAQ